MITNSHKKGVSNQTHMAFLLFVIRESLLKKCASFQRSLSHSLIVCCAYYALFLPSFLPFFVLFVPCCHICMFRLAFKCPHLALIMHL